MDDNDIESGIEDQAPPDDNHTIIRLLEPNEKVGLIVNIKYIIVKIV